MAAPGIVTGTDVSGRLEKGYMCRQPVMKSLKLHRIAIRPQVPINIGEYVIIYIAEENRLTADNGEE